MNRYATSPIAVTRLRIYASMPKCPLRKSNQRRKRSFLFSGRERFIIRKAEFGIGNAQFESSRVLILHWQFRIHVAHCHFEIPSPRGRRDSQHLSHRAERDVSVPST